MELLKMRVAQMRAAELPGLLNSLMLPHKRNLRELFLICPHFLGVNSPDSCGQLALILRSLPKCAEIARHGPDRFSQV
jgi:hypothetical protein